MGKCLHGQHGQSVQSEYSNHMYMHSVQRIKVTKMSLENIVDEICEISFDFLEEFCQGELNCFISCTIDGQNNLVDIKLIIERNEKLFLNSTLEVKLTLICLLIF